MTTFNYNRNDVHYGIVHFGVGNFHRAHLEYYTNLLMEDKDQQQWGVFGAMIMPSDQTLYKALKEDDGIYNLTTCAPDGENMTYQIGSLVKLAWGEEDPEAIISAIADAQVKIISLTITEGGYKVNFDSSKSVFWYVTEGLKRRMKQNLPITILSCDNLQHNGNTAREAFLSYFRAKCPELAEWAIENVSFPNSMVDRITPATKSGKVTDVRCEDFVQWVIEDDFKAGRPSWDRVGVQFTDDVSPYENMKLSLLNGSHSLLCYGAYLEGFRKVDDVMSDSRYKQLVRDFMDLDVTPFVPAPEGIDLNEYKDTLIKRFANPAISDQVARLCADGLARFAVYIVPTLKLMFLNGKDTSRLAFHFANYYKYLVRAVTESGESIYIDEPHMTQEDREIIDRGDMMEFLNLSPFKGIDFISQSKFIEKFKHFVSLSVSEGLSILTKTL